MRGTYGKAEIEKAHFRKATIKKWVTHSCITEDRTQLTVARNLSQLSH